MKKHKQQEKPRRRYFVEFRFSIMSSLVIPTCFCECIQTTKRKLSPQAIML